MAMLKIADKEIKLILDTETYDEICQKGYYVEEIDDRFAGPDRVKMLCELIAIMGSHGSGENIPVEWVRKNLKFAQHPTAKAAVITTILEAMRSETAEEKAKDEVVDVVLEEIEKKKEQEG